MTYSRSAKRRIGRLAGEDRLEGGRPKVSTSRYRFGPLTHLWASNGHQMGIKAANAGRFLLPFLSTTQLALTSRLLSAALADPDGLHMSWWVSRMGPGTVRDGPLPPA